MTTPHIRDLLAHISADAASTPEAITARLTRLLDAPAPANSCVLPGAVGDVIRAIAAELDLPCAPLGSSGNLGIELGDLDAPLDLLVTAHMDRPCFRVRNLAEATLYPLCAIRVPGDGYTCEARALRFVDGRVSTVASGRLHFAGDGDDYRIRFLADEGELAWGDTVMMHCAPTLSEGLISGTGLDNAIGVILALLSAHSLNQHAADSLEGRRLLFALTDQEEGPPVGLFGQGAARLAHALEPPHLGFINIDAHNVGASTGHAPGIGASHAFVSGYGRGSVVPLDYQALATDLAEAVNRARPGTVKLNYGYVSRSDDMLLSLNARCLALTGVVLENAHTTDETVALGDLVAGVLWLSGFVSKILESK
ncbi:MAG: hypothetical protein OXE52_08145 [Chloroflexi bacterium]|nr:hypothetical protein [Chloroflexota bacterium]